MAAIDEHDLARRLYAEELRTAGPLGRDEVVDAFARVPRERFLGPPPWQIWSGPARSQETADGDPRHVYKNVVISIDPKRLLNNGQPSFVGMMIDQSGASKGQHVVHVGCGTGYYSCIFAEIVGESGYVTAIELDSGLAERARANLANHPQVEVVNGDGTVFDAGPADAILINAGATHPVPLWLDSLLPGATLILPLTVAMPIHGGGSVLKVTRERTGLGAAFISGVGIFHCAGGRDAEMNRRLGAAFAAGLEAAAKVQSLLRTPHDESETCWLHTDAFCLSTLALP